ncbi:hypothetical protein Lepto7376_0378 [[Leptolyngbya] sp. PCC 7376]|nr:hypothetical protein Lepto7376_0378 [[Leptolyngbya] sp. PCC 7376]
MINTETSAQDSYRKKALRILRRFVIILGLSLLLLLGDSFWAPLSNAEIRQYHNGTGEMLDQSRRSMRDIDRRSWQVVVFQDVQDGVIGHTELRLVGFPGQIEFQHPQPLVIRTRTGQDFQAHDEFEDGAPMASVGQFDVTEIVSQLPEDEPVILELPTIPRSILKIPTSFVLEWQLIS